MKHESAEILGKGRVDQRYTEHFRRLERAEKDVRRVSTLSASKRRCCRGDQSAAASLAPRFLHFYLLCSKNKSQRPPPCLHMNMAGHPPPCPPSRRRLPQPPRYPPTPTHATPI